LLTERKEKINEMKRERDEFRPRYSWKNSPPRPRS
jgi:hypothetical protein